MAMTAACGEGGVARPGNPGIGGGAGLAANLIGVWERTLIIQDPDDVHVSETVWTFRTDASCERAVTTTTVSAGFSETLTRPCTYALDRGDVTIAFDGSAVPVTFTAVVTGNSLFLDGVEFRRV